LKPSTPTTAAPLSCRQLAEVARQALARLLSLEVGEGLDRIGIVAPDDQHGLRDDVGSGEIVLRLAGVGDRHLVDHGVVALDVEAGDEAVPLALDELRLHAEPLRDLLSDLDVEADQGPRGVVEGERRIGPLGADLEDCPLP
jgi:hypothetical protein